MTETPHPIGLAEALGLLPSNDKTHYEALGRLIASFAHAEGIVHVLARKLSGLSDEKARILFGGMRLSDVIDRIRQFMQLDEMSDDIFAEIDVCLTQFMLIADRRHKLVHRGATYFAGTLISSNAMTSRSAANIEVETLEELLLTAMAADCSTIYLRLSYVEKPESADPALLVQMKAAPWRYTPPSPSPQNQRRPKVPKSPTRPPDASSE